MARRTHWGNILLSPMGGPNEYLLQDEFNDTRAAGAVNGTLATPGPGTRTDPNNNTSVGSGVLLINSATDILYFDETVTRAVGVVYVAQITAAASTDMDVVSVGFDDAKTAAPDRCAIRFAASDVLQAVEDGTAVAIGSYAGETSITVAFSLRATGAYFHVQFGTGDWTFYKIGNVNSTASLFAGVGGSGGAPAVSVAWHRVPARTWIDRPALYDPFPTDGALTTSASTGPDGQVCPARTWSGATWTVAGGKMVNTPTLGAEIIPNPELTTNTTGWAASNCTLSRVDSGTDPGSSSGGSDDWCLKEVVDGASPAAQGATTNPLGTWCRFSCRVYAPNANTRANVGRMHCQNTTALTQVNTSEDIWNALSATGRVTTANPSMRLLGDIAGGLSTIGDIAYWDAINVKALTLSELINVPDLSVANVVAEIEIAVDPDGTQAGLAIGWDSQSSPANGILVYHDGTNVKIDKNVAGTWTAVQSTATAFSADAKLVCVRDGSSVTAYYNNVLIGATQTISDAAILAGTRHGMFSTNATPTMDNVLVMPRAGGNYPDLDQWSGVNP